FSVATSKTQVERGEQQSLKTIRITLLKTLPDITNWPQKHINDTLNDI
ncbi:MAG: hypothetical protein ACI9FB_004267, partial [Candidatus Azotimanducaceae bacterium]